MLVTLRGLRVNTLTLVEINSWFHIWSPSFYDAAVLKCRCRKIDVRLCKSK